MPRNSDIEAQLQDRIDTFVEEISVLIREAAVDAVRGALMAEGGAAPAKPAARRKATKRAPARRKKTKGGRRIRRSAEDLEKIGAEFLAHVKSHPGQRLEEIGAALAVDTAILKRPVKLLLDDKQLRTEGQRRGTKYFAGAGGRRKAATKKGSAKKTAKKRSTKKRSTKKRASKKAARKTARK